MKPSRLVLATLIALGAPVVHAQEHAHAAHAAPATDSRVLLPLNAAERAVVLEEMRAFLAGVQQMTAALATQDMATTARAARGLGQVMVHDVPPALREKLPTEFRQLGFSVHRDFDQIALDAETMKDVSHTLNQLSGTLQKCVACHASYQIPSSLSAH